LGKVEADENIVGLEIAVQDAVVMKVLYSRRNLHGQARNGLRVNEAVENFV